jgi:hypothetical protein
MFGRGKEVAGAMPSGFITAQRVLAELLVDNRPNQGIMGRLGRRAEMAFVIAKARILPVEERKQLVGKILEKVNERREEELGAYVTEQLQTELYKFLGIPTEDDLKDIIRW